MVPLGGSVSHSPRPRTLSPTTSSASTEGLHQLCRTSLLHNEDSSGFVTLVSSFTRAFHLVLEPYSKSKSRLSTDSVSLPPFLFVNRLSHHIGNRSSPEFTASASYSHYRELQNSHLLVYREFEF